MFAKKFLNPLMYVEVIARQISDMFRDTVYITSFILISYDLFRIIASLRKITTFQSLSSIQCAR